MQTYDMVQAGYGEADITPDSPAEMAVSYTHLTLPTKLEV